MKNIAMVKVDGSSGYLNFWGEGEPFDPVQPPK